MRDLTCLVVEFNWGEFSSNETTPSSVLVNFGFSRNLGQFSCGLVRG